MQRSRLQKVFLHQRAEGFRMSLQKCNSTLCGIIGHLFMHLTANAEAGDEVEKVCMFIFV